MREPASEEKDKLCRSFCEVLRRKFDAVQLRKKMGTSQREIR